MRVLALDQGTSGTKAVVVDDGVVVASAEEPVRPAYLSDGRVEQDPAALLASVLEAGRRAVADAGGSLDAVALANQGETVLAWDPESGAPLTTAIVWQDGRAESVCTDLAEHGERVAADRDARAGEERGPAEREALTGARRLAISSLARTTAADASAA